jgi:predicted transcriptional regulator
MNSETNGSARHTMSVRFSPEVWEMLEQLAFEARRKTGVRVSYSALLSAFVEAEHSKLGGRRKQLKALWNKGPTERTKR